MEKDETARQRACEPSTRYDATRRAVRFWGHESTMESSFFMIEDALKRIQPDMMFGRAGALQALT